MAIKISVSSNLIKTQSSLFLHGAAAKLKDCHTAHGGGWATPREVGTGIRRLDVVRGKSYLLQAEYSWIDCSGLLQSSLQGLQHRQ